MNLHLRKKAQYNYFVSDATVGKFLVNIPIYKNQISVNLNAELTHKQFYNISRMSKVCADDTMQKQV